MKKWRPLFSSSSIPDPKSSLFHRPFRPFNDVSLHANRSFLRSFTRSDNPFAFSNPFSRFSPNPARCPKPPPQFAQPYRISCYRCRRYGHTARMCKIPLRCYSCSATGHKSVNCPKFRKSAQDLNFGSVKMQGESQAYVDSEERVDSMLLDPDVLRCPSLCFQPVPGSGSQRFASSRIGLEQVKEVKRPLMDDIRNQTIIPTGLRPKFCSFSAGSGSFKMVSDRGKELVPPAIARLRKRVKHCRLAGKGKDLGFPAKSWHMLGMAVLEVSNIANVPMADPCSDLLATEDDKDPACAYVHDSPITVEESTSSDDEDLSHHSSSNYLPQVELDLAPFRFEDLQVVEVIDSLEVGLRIDDLSLKSSSSVIEYSNANLPEENPPLQPEAVPKKPKGSSKPFSPSKIRRSPRLSRAPFSRGGMGF